MNKIKIRKKHFLFLIGIILAITICTSLLVYLIVNKNRQENEVLKNIKLPRKFQIGIFASDLGGNVFAYPGPNQGPRFMEFYNDALFVSVPSAGKIIALPDRNNDGAADEKIEAIGGLDNPHGIAFYDDWMYVANEGSIIRVKIDDNLKAIDGTKEHIADLPSGGHWTRTIRIIDGSLYVSIGSSCNLCEEKDERRASIMKCGLEGGCRMFAQGIRNAVGFAFDKDTKRIFATENSRDMLGDDLPPDEINIINEGGHYGWPYCYGRNMQDPEFNQGCDDKEPSYIDLQAHSAPLGMAFNYGKDFQISYYGDLFVAYHGSWNRKEKTGYKIVRIKLGENKVEDFATGWVQNGKVLGRPVDIIFDKNGIMYVSDDFTGMIYRISFDRTGLI